MTYVVSKVSGLPKNRVFGSVTVLDTARLRFLIADYLEVGYKTLLTYKSKRIYYIFVRV